MSDEQNIVYVNAQIVCANAEIEAMKIANIDRANNRQCPQYGYNAFMKVPVKYGLTHNLVLPILLDH